MPNCESQEISVVILAGGRGTRIRTIHPNTPKPLVPVCGRPFLHWLTLWLVKHGLTHFVYSIGHLGEQIESWCAKVELQGVTRICCRETEPLGTGGGLLNCLGECRKWVLVANGDGICTGSVAELLRLHRDDGLLGALSAIPVKDTARFGSISVGPDGYLEAIREKVSGSGLVNSGFYLFQADFLRRFQRAGPLSIERELIAEMLSTGAKLKVALPSSSSFIDIGTPDSLVAAKDFVLRHVIGALDKR